MPALNQSRVTDELSFVFQVPKQSDQLIIAISNLQQTIMYVGERRGRRRRGSCKPGGLQLHERLNWMWLCCIWSAVSDQHNHQRLHVLHLDCVPDGGRMWLFTSVSTQRACEREPTARQGTSSIRNMLVYAYIHRVVCLYTGTVQDPKDTPMHGLHYCSEREQLHFALYNSHVYCCSAAFYKAKVW